MGKWSDISVIIIAEVILFKHCVLCKCYVYK